MAERFAALIVRGRYVVVLAWLAGAVAATLLLPSIREAQTGALGDLVPVDADAIAVEERSAELFAFPFLSRTVVVTRDPGGLTASEQARLGFAAVQLNRGVLPELPEARSYLVPNAVGSPPLIRERGTSILFPLLFPLSVDPDGRSAAADRFAREHVAPRVEGGYSGVTGAIPARAAQAELIEEHLPFVELATLLFVLLAVGLYFRAVAAPLVNLVAVAIAFLVSIRVIATVGQAIGVSVPSEVQPVIVALMFGVVTDYSLFYLSRYRRHLGDGIAPMAAATRTTAELLPIISACGLAVVAACGALGVAQLGFLQAFGPGMAMAVLVALAVALTFVPAALALLGPRLFWPSGHRAPLVNAPSRTPLTARLVRFAVGHPRRTIAACLVVLGAMSAGGLYLHLGNPLIRGLPSDEDTRVAYAQAARGFTPGAIAPTIVVVEAPGLSQRRAALARLQRLLDDQPGVAEVVGPASNPTSRRFGAVLSPGGDAARFVLFLASDPLGAAAVETVRRLRAAAPGLARQAGLVDPRIGFAGDTALSQETIDETVDDLVRVIPAVLLAILLVLVVFLRSLVAPLYLVAAAALGPLAALGLTVAFFQGLLDQTELTYYVPVAAGVLLVALGSDYNIFLVGRVWDEARRRPLEEAVVVAGAGAARAISAAGIVLAASFGAMALVPVGPFRELAFLMAAGLLIDAFVVRTILVPAVIALVGYRSGWPGRRLRRRGGSTAAVKRMTAAPRDRPREAVRPHRADTASGRTPATVDGELVCLVDRGPAGPIAAHVAARLAERLDLRLALLDVQIPVVPPGAAIGGLDPLTPSVVVPPERAEPEPQPLADWEAALVCDAPRRRETLAGPAADALGRLSQAPTTRLVVAVDTGGGALSTLLAGNPGREAARHARCPVLLVPETLATEPTLRDVVCGAAGDDAAVAAAAVAGALATRLGGRLRFVHVLPRPLSGARRGFRPLDELDPDAREAAEAAFAACSAAAGADADPELVVVEGDAADGLQATWREIGGGVVVVGAPRHGALGSAVFGSAAHELLRRGAMPVVVVSQESEVAS